MKKEIASRWADALKSKKYKQGTGRLRSAYDEFCCLGVLCNLHAQDHPKVARKQTNKEEYLGEIFALPYDVAEWAGVISLVCGDVQIGKATAIRTNDVLKVPFDKIGDRILKHWETI